MPSRLFPVVLIGTLCIGLFLVRPAAAGDGDGDTTSPEGVEVQTRGPVHEAYAEPGGVQPAPAPVVPQGPPPAIEETPPDQKPEGEHVQWFPGYFAWDEEKSDFLWVSGFWRAIPPGRQWVPGTWQK